PLPRVTCIRCPVPRPPYATPFPSTPLFRSKPRYTTVPALTTLAAAVALGAPMVASAAWEPTKPVEFIIPAGTGGGADQMARFIQDRKSTRLNSSHVKIPYAVFCLKKKKKLV